MLPEKLGPYRLVQRLGRGGMGTVFEGLNTETGQPAAIKVLNPHLAAEEGFRERFEIEIETLKKLKHPNIVRLYGFGEQDGQLYYAMELVHGASLEDELQAGRRFTWRETTQVGIKLLRALKHAHDHGVIHRDLKPANLLLTIDGELKLADFGIARLFGNSRLTSTGGPIGTAEYMAPEQADGRGITPHCDLYSTGGVLFAMLAGRPPFRGTSILEVLQMHHSAEPPLVTRFAHDAPKELAELIAQLLAKDPADRGANASIVARQLSALEHGLSLTAGTHALQEPSGDPVGQASGLTAPAQEAENQLAAPPGDTTAPGVASCGTGKRSLPVPAREPPPGYYPLAATGQFDSLVPPADAAAANLLGTPTRPATARGVSPFAEPTHSGERSRTENNPPSPSPPAALPSVAPAPVSRVEPIKLSVRPKSPPPAAAGSGPNSAPPAADLTRSNSVLTTPDLLSSPAAATESANRFVTVEEDERRRRAADVDSEHRTPWMQVALLSVGLAGLIGLGWYLLRPPSADVLYGRIQAVAAAGQPQQLLDAEADIDSFLARFPTDPRAAQLKGYREEIELVRLERSVQLQARLAGGDAPVSPIQRDFLAAIGQATTDPDRAVAKLQALVDFYSQSGDSSPTTTRLLELSRRQLVRLRAQVSDEARQSLALIDASLRRAVELQTTNPPAARAIWQGIVELYSDKPWAAERVSRAKASLEGSAAASSRQ